MSHDHPSHHIGSVKLYVAIFAAAHRRHRCSPAAVAFVDLGPFNTVVALLIAVIKASLVVLFFMGVRYNTPLTRVVAVSGFVWLLILFGLDDERLPHARLDWGCRGGNGIAPLDGARAS